MSTRKDERDNDNATKEGKRTAEYSKTGTEAAVLGIPTMESKTEAKVQVRI